MTDEQALHRAAEKACEFDDVFETYVPLLGSATTIAEWWIHYKRLVKAWRSEHPPSNETTEETT